MSPEPNRRLYTMPKISRKTLEILWDLPPTSAKPLGKLLTQVTIAVYDPKTESWRDGSADRNAQHAPIRLDE